MKTRKLKTVSAPQNASQETSAPEEQMTLIERSTAHLKAELASMRVDLHELYERAPQSL